MKKSEENYCNHPECFGESHRARDWNVTFYLFFEDFAFLLSNLQLLRFLLGVESQAEILEIAIPEHLRNDII